MVVDGLSMVLNKSFIKWSKTSKVMHWTPQKVTFWFKDSLFLRYISYVSNLILPKFGMNASITKMQIFDDMKFDLIIITLTYVLMDNLCPCFFLDIPIFIGWIEESHIYTEDISEASFLPLKIVLPLGHIRQEVSQNTLSLIRY